MNAMQSIRASGLLILLAIAFSTGCYTVTRHPPLTAEQVVELSKRGQSVDEIIGKIQETGTIYYLKSGQVRELLDRGVEEPVVDFMLETRVEAEKARARAYYYHYDYGPYYYHRPYGFHYGFHYRHCH